MRYALFRRRLLIAATPLVVGSAVGAQATGAPPGDPARALDAELRIAIFDLLQGQHLPALSRLQRVDAMAASARVSSGALLGRDVHQFLLAQTYYRLGMDSSFRATAAAVLAEPAAARFAPALRSLLLVDAYRIGDYARAAEFARTTDGSEAGALAALVAGLAAYRANAYSEARAAFARALQAGEPYAGYARFMDALATLRGDTTQRAAALTALEALAGSASGEFAEQVRLTAAQLAYENEQYDRAVTLASAVTGGGLVAPALLTKAWALYKSDKFAEAGAAFAEFATRFPDLPERDESRLMAAQVLLQLGRTADAERAFRGVADSAAAESALLQGAASPALSAAARVLVTDRAASLLFVGDPAAGKTLAIHDSAGAEGAVLTAVLTGQGAPRSGLGFPEVVSLADVSERFSRLSTPLDASFPRRLLFAPASATNHPRQIAAQSQSLLDADAAVALNRFRVEERMSELSRDSLLLASAQQALAGERAQIDALAAEYNAVKDSLAKLEAMTSLAESRIRALFRTQIDGARTLARENARTADSLRAALADRAGPDERRTIETEARTAATYLAIAEVADSGLTRAIAAHPTFALRDSVRAHNEKARSTLAELTAAFERTQGAILAALTQARSAGSASAREALAAAEARRAAVEAELAAAVTAELTARAGELVATLGRDAEAAQFGTASAAFFQAIDDGRATESAAAPPRRAGTGTSPSVAGPTSGAGSSGNARTPNPTPKR